MSKIDCGTGNTPCGCDCGHPSAQHVTYERWRARCTVVGCICEWLDVCDCVGTGDGSGAPETDQAILAACGIASGA